MAGRTAEARGILGRLIEMQSGRYSSPWAIAAIYYALGETDSTLDWLEKAYEQRDRAVTVIGVHPRYDALRSHPRYVALVEKMKFPR